jgi:tRNA1Val (adenine37-N6)-methyltransferase
MSASTFQFKKFTIQQERCAMKVGTDGVLLGAWVKVPKEGKILDIGTGTGLIALMMAQKTDAFIDAIDIDFSAFEQAGENVKSSPWNDHVRVLHSSLNDFKPGYRYDLIVSNPPYFIDSYAASDEARNMARSASASLSYEDLLFGVGRLLTNTGKFSTILPFKEGQYFRELAEQSGLICIKLSKVKTGRDKPFKRVLMEFSRREEKFQEEELVIHFDNRDFTEEYKKLTSDYYMAF